MPDVALSSTQVIEALGRVELEMKHLGLVNHALGVRAAIVAVIRLVQHPEPVAPLDPSE